MEVVDAAILDSAIFESAKQPFAEGGDSLANFGRTFLLIPFKVEIFLLTSPVPFAILIIHRRDVYQD